MYALPDATQEVHELRRDIRDVGRLNWHSGVSNQQYNNDILTAKEVKQPCTGCFSCGRWIFVPLVAPTAAVVKAVAAGVLGLLGSLLTLAATPLLRAELPANVLACLNTHLRVITDKTGRLKTDFLC